MNSRTWKDDAERRSLRSIFRRTERFWSLDQDMPLTQLVVFLHVALNEGTTQRDVANSLGLSTSAVSRTVAALSATHRLGKPGLDLVAWHENPEDRRAKLLFLTPKGRALARQFLED